MIFKIPKLPILFKLVILITFVELFFFYILRIIGFGIFDLVPFLRLISVFFLGFYLLEAKYITTSIFKIDKTQTIENNFVFFWAIINVFSLIYGIIKLNPIVYIVTDFMYILIGFVLFRIFQTNRNSFNFINEGILSIKQNKYIAKLFVFFAIISALLKIEMPSFFIVFTISYSLYLFFQKNYKYSILFLIPFFFHVYKANRSLLVVFILALILAYLRKRITKNNIISVFIFLIIIFSSIIYWSEEILKFIINNLENGLLKFRIQQLYLISSGKINWNAPNVLSLKQRLEEMELVIEYWLSNPIFFLFGGGNGATIDGTAFKDVGVQTGSLVGKQAIHNIHLLPFSLILRYGFFGVLLFLYLLNILKEFFFNIVLSNILNFKILIYIYVSLWIVYSLPAASFLWTNSLFWISFGLLSSKCNN